MNIHLYIILYISTFFHVSLLWQLRVYFSVKEISREIFRDLEGHVFGYFTLE